MLASSTVENYLKAIYHGTAALERGQRLLPMGQLAGAVGVAPGTATTMVKTLAESGLVEYEPYAGVALTAAGQKLAALVLRRLPQVVEEVVPPGDRSKHGLDAGRVAADNVDRHGPSITTVANAGAGLSPSLDTS